MNGDGMKMIEDYCIIINLDKKQFLYPRDYRDSAVFGSGGGFSHNEKGTMAALAILLTKNPIDGYEHELAGTWAGDRIAIVSDEGGDQDRNEAAAFGITDNDGVSMYYYARDHFEQLQMVGLKDVYCTPTNE